MIYHNNRVGMYVRQPYIVLKSPDLSCETYLSTPQMVARTVTSQNNLKNLHLTGSAEMKNVSKVPPHYLIAQNNGLCFF